MKNLILMIFLLMSSNIVAGEGSVIGGGNHINRIKIDNVLLDSVLIPNKDINAISIGETTYKKIGSSFNEVTLQKGEGFLIDLSRVDSIDTENGILNLDDFKLKPRTQLLIDEESKIRDIFTKDGELIIFN